MTVACGRGWGGLLVLVVAASLGGGACVTARAGGREAGQGGAGDAADSVTDDRSAAELFRSGMEAQRMGDSTRAEQYFGAALARGYPVEEAFPALINVCLATDRFDTALYYARARLLKQPDDWPLRYLVATLLISAGQETRAVPEIHRLIDEQPRRPEPHYLLAVVARDSLGDRSLAAASFGTYLALAPDGAHGSEARAFLKQERRAAAGGATVTP